jgi:hypothetical protein
MVGKIPSVLGFKNLKSYSFFKCRELGHYMLHPINIRVSKLAVFIAPNDYISIFLAPR